MKQMIEDDRGKPLSREAILSFARDELKLFANDVDASNSTHVWAKAAAVGLISELIPSVSDLDLLGRTIMILKAIGEVSGNGGFVLSLVAHAFACALPIRLAGRSAYSRAVLSGLQSGALVGACCMTERQSGSDAFALETTSVRDGEGYVLNGTKLFVTNGTVADIFLVYARTSKQPGPLGCTAFVVDRRCHGLQIEPGQRKSGLRTVDWATLHLHNCHVPADARIGEEGGGAALFREAMNWERTAVSAASVGAMAASLERCTTLVRSHQRFSQKLVEFQTVAHRLVDMRIRIETGNALLSQIEKGHKDGSPTEDLAAIAKLVIIDAAFQSGMDEAKLQGANGVAIDADGNRFMADSFALQTASGTGDVQRMLIAQHMGLR